MTDEEKIKALVDSFNIMFADIVATELELIRKLAKIKSTLEEYDFVFKFDDKKPEGGDK